MVTIAPIDCQWDQKHYRTSCQLFRWCSYRDFVSILDIWSRCIWLARFYFLTLSSLIFVSSSLCCFLLFFSVQNYRVLFVSVFFFLALFFAFFKHFFIYCAWMFSFDSVNSMDFVFAIWIPPRGIISMSVLRSENRNSNMKSI